MGYLHLCTCVLWVMFVVFILYDELNAFGYVAHYQPLFKKNPNGFVYFLKDHIWTFKSTIDNNILKKC